MVAQAYNPRCSGSDDRITAQGQSEQTLLRLLSQKLIVEVVHTCNLSY
jgi:hypothetical protein